MNKAFTLLMCFSLLAQPVQAQYWEGDSWYSNPLGFEPVKLHTSMGVILPAVAVGVCLLLTKKDTALQKRFSFYNETGFSWGYKYPYTFLSQNSTGFNIMLRKFLSVGAEFDVYFPRDSYNNTVGFTLRPFARFYPVNRKNWRLYFESGGGFIYFVDEFPQPTERDNRLGTQWNGTTKYGIGTEIFFADRWGLNAGIRHVHVSNGNAKGVERNPSHDSNGFFVGLTYLLK